MLKTIRMIAIHIAMVSIVLSISSFVNYYLIISIGKDIYTATLVSSIYLQIVLGVNLFCMLSNTDISLDEIVDLNAANMYLIFFILITLLTLTITFNANLLVVFVCIVGNGLLSHRICKSHKENSASTP